MNDQPNGPNSSSDSIDPPRITYASPGGPRAPSHLELLLSDTGRSYDYQDVPTMSVLYQFWGRFCITQVLGEVVEPPGLVGVGAPLVVEVDSSRCSE